MTEPVDLIWEALLEPLDQQGFRQLTCGCLVRRDGADLDLFIWSGATAQCDQHCAHEVVLAYRQYADLGVIDPHAAALDLLRAVRGYTDGWGEEGLTALRTLAAALRLPPAARPGAGPVPRPGDRIELVSMPDDPDPVAAGATGTVRHVRPAGPHHQVEVAWDDAARSLALVIPPDVVRVISGR